MRATGPAKIVDVKTHGHFLPLAGDLSLASGKNDLLVASQHPLSRFLCLALRGFNTVDGLVHVGNEIWHRLWTDASQYATKLRCVHPDSSGELVLNGRR